jgi:hypothetical protein
MNKEENEIEEWEEPKVEEAIDILKKYFKITFEKAGMEWTDKNDKEIRFAILEIVNAPIYEIRQALLEDCDCDEDCTCDEE